MAKEGFMHVGGLLYDPEIILLIFVFIALVMSRFEFDIALSNRSVCINYDIWSK